MPLLATRASARVVLPAITKGYHAYHGRLRLTHIGRNGTQYALELRPAHMLIETQCNEHRPLTSYTLLTNRDVLYLMLIRREVKWKISGVKTMTWQVWKRLYSGAKTMATDETRACWNRGQTCHLPWSTWARMQMFLMFCWRLWSDSKSFTLRAAIFVVGGIA